MGAVQSTLAPTPPVADRPTLPQLRWYLVALAVAVIAAPVIATIGVGAGGYVSINRDDPGRVTGVITTVMHSVAALASLVSVGALASALFAGRLRAVREGGSRRQLDVREWLEPVVLKRAAAFWVVASGLLIVLDSADTNGLPISRFSDLPALRFALTSGDFGRAWMVSFAAALVVYLTAAFSLSWVTYLIALGAALAGSLAPVVVGQVLVGPRHDFGGDSAVYQTVAGQLLFGIAVIAVLRLASGRKVRVLERTHWRSTAKALLVVLILTEVVLLWFKLAGSDLFGTSTGRLGIVRLLGLGLAAAGLLAAKRPAKGVALLVSGAAVFVAGGLAMDRIPPPQFFVPTSISQIMFGFDLRTPPGFASLAGHWRPNLLFVTAAAVAITAYLAAVRRVRRRGEKWPVLRTIAWLIGWLLLVVVTSSGLGKYSGADFAVHMAVHMTLSMLIPLPLVLAGPITLALRALPPAGKDQQPGPHEWIVAALHSRQLTALYHPLLVFGVYIGSYYALYLTGAFGTLMRFHWAHQLMNVHFLLIGCLYFGLVIGVDPTPRRLPSLAKLGFVMAAMPFHAFFGVILMSGGSTIGQAFYQHLELPWPRDLADIQQTAGGIAWAGGEIPLLVVIAVLALQWAAQDRKEARRIDRHLDAGLDDSFDAYNAMLERLSRRTDDSRPAPEKLS